MSAGAIAAIIVAVALVVLVVSAMTMARRRRLRQRFGPEYDRMVEQTHSQRKAEAELAARERRVRSLDIRPLPDEARERYAAEWTGIQERFVDQPAYAVTQAALLVVAVMKERGYPTDDQQQVMADLSVEHASTLEHYRAAHKISMDAEAGTASTEDLRMAMLHYRALFDDLLGTQARPGDTETSAVGDRTEGDTTVGDSAAARDPGVTGGAVASEDPVASDADANGRAPADATTAEGAADSTAPADTEGGAREAPEGPAEPAVPGPRTRPPAES